MASRFHALFGICRRKGGTKKTCYQKAVKAVGSSRRGRKKTRRGKCKRYRKVCAEYR